MKNRRRKKNEFRKVEETLIRKNTNRVHDALAENLASLHSKSSDWANWDDTYEFIKDHNQEYKDSNLQTESLGNLNLDFMLF